MDYKSLKLELLSGKKSNFNWFKINNYLLEYAYSLLLNDDLDKAENVFSKISDYDIRGDWGKKIIPILKNQKITNYPSYLQVRNFLEIDLDIFLQHNKKEYSENIINSAEIFFEICRESYKFIGRSLYYNNYKDLALKIFLLAKEKFYKDAELHFLLGKIFFEKKEKEKSRHALLVCLELVSEYKPAKDMLNILDKI